MNDRTNPTPEEDSLNEFADRLLAKLLPKLKAAAPAPTPPAPAVPPTPAPAVLRGPAGGPDGPKDADCEGLTVGQAQETGNQRLVAAVRAYREKKLADANLEAALAAAEKDSAAK